METRKITIVSTRDQKKSTIMSSATTLSELKSDLRNEGIDYSGMTFYEGISKTELKDDASVLPHDVPYKGTTTNELVFMLTNSNKKIKSGAMSRSDVYDVIKNMGLQTDCINKFGKNYTVCKTDDLLALIEESQKKVSKKVVKTTITEETETTETPVEEHNDCVDTKARNAIIVLLNILKDGGNIYSSELKTVMNVLSTENNTDNDSSPYSDEDIDEMFGFVNN